MQLLPIYGTIRIDSVKNNVSVAFSDDYIRSRAVRENVAKREGHSFERKHRRSQFDLLGMLHDGFSIGADNDSIDMLVKMYSPTSSISTYSEARLLYRYIRDSKVCFYPSRESILINWEEVEWSNTGLPLNVVVHQNEGDATYSARISIKGKTIHSNNFSTAEEAVLAQKQMEYMKQNGFFN